MKQPLSFVFGSLTFSICVASAPAQVHRFLYPATDVTSGHRGKGWLSVSGGPPIVRFRDAHKANFSFEVPCENFAARSKWSRDVLQITSDGVYDLKVNNPSAAQEWIREECAIAGRLAADIRDEADRIARTRAERAVAEERAAAEAEAERLAGEAERKRLAETYRAQREAKFRNAILKAREAAEEHDPFASIREEFDLSGPDSRQWKTSLQLPDAEKCTLLKTPAPTPTAASAWTFACMFRASTDSYERMVKSVQSVLNLPFQPDERAVNINQVFFADPSKPAWRFFVAKMKDATVGVSVVAVRFAGVPTTVANTTPFPTVATMLPTEPTVGDGTEKLPSGQTQAAANGAECDAYQKGERERASRQQEFLRLGTELSGLQTSYQEAMRQLLEAQQREPVNSGNAGQKGLLGVIGTVGATADRLSIQHYQSEAQSLQLQINQKQSQITIAQTSLLALPRTAPPVGCSGSRTSDGSNPASHIVAPSATITQQSGLKAQEPATTDQPTELTVREEVEKIRAGTYAPMPPAQLTTAGVSAVSGRTTMIVKNSTAYELSVFFDGPVSKKLALTPGASQDLDLAPGTFHVAGRVAASDVLPFYGDETYVGSARYSITFYIAP